jgi:hypothetical protein
MTINKSNTICFAPQHNKRFRSDATGAFQPEANSFAEFHKIPPVNVFFLDNKLPRKVVKELIINAIEMIKPDNIAFFCHGWKNGIQLGLDTSNVKSIVMPWVKNPVITLYACSCGTGDNVGFADALRDHLCKSGSPNNIINAHYTDGHTTHNPNLKRFEGRGSLIGGIDGIKIVSPKSKKEFAKCRELLKKTAFRFDFPFLSLAEIHLTIDNDRENLYPVV